MRSVTVKELAKMFFQGEVETGEFTAMEWVMLAEAVPRTRWSRLDTDRFAVRLDSGRWRVYTWQKHDPDEDGHVVSVRAVGWM